MPDRKTRLTRRLLVFGPAMIVVLTGLLSYAGLRRSLDTRDWVAHTHEVLDASSALLTSLLDAETAERGYLLTRDSTVLEPYRTVGPRADSALVQLRALTVDNPRQQTRIDTLAAEARRRLAVIDSSLAVARAGRAADAADVVAHGNGRFLMSRVRRLVGEVDADENRLLLVREERERRANDVTSALLLAGTLAAALLAFIVNRNLDRALVARRSALAEAEAANEQLQEQAIELEVQADASQSTALEAELATERAEEAMHAAEASERRAERLQVATQAFGGALSLQQVANLIVEQAASALPADSALLAAVEPSRTRIRFVAVRNVNVVKVGETVDIADEMPLCAAVRTAKPVLIEQPVSPDGRFGRVAPIHAREGVRSIGAFPMEYNGQVLGALLVRFNEARTFSEADVAFLAALTRIAAESFERARLFEAEREARTAAEGANRAKAAFLASMSHELRTPLQAALGFAQLVRSGVYGDVNPQQAEVLGRVERSQTHLARLIDDILDFARLEAGRVRIASEPVVVGEVIAEIAPLVESQAVAKEVELTVPPVPDSLVAAADRHRLRQILLNLVGNAIKFTPRNGRVSLCAARDGDVVTILVSDTGPGIPPDRLQAVFEPFVQVDDALTRVHEGAGLGLAISRDLARAMGGDITVDTVLDKGSTFIVTLPRAGSLAVL